MKNLKRYDPCNERMGRALVPGMTESKGGVFVKLSDVNDILKSIDNKQSNGLLCPKCGKSDKLSFYCDHCVDIRAIPYALESKLTPTDKQSDSCNGTGKL